MLRPAARTPNRGYSMVEICMTIAILGILLSMGLWNFHKSKANRELDAAAVEMSNALKYARQMAISSGGASVVFSTPSGGLVSYTVSTAGGQLLKKFTMPRNVSLTVPSGMSTLTFNPNGSTTAGGTYTITTSVTGRSGTINVVQTAGTTTLTLP